MISSFEVAAIFSLEDAASEPLAAIAEGMERVAELAATARKALVDLGSATLSKAAAGIDHLAESLAALNRNAEGFAGGMESASAAAGAAAAGAAANINDVTAAYERAIAVQDRFRQAAAERLALPGGSYEGEIGGPDVVPYRAGGVGGPRSRVGETIDHLPFENDPLLLGYSGGGGGDTGSGYGAPMVMGRGFGRGGRGTRSPGPGGFTNWHAEDDSPPINLGGGERPHDPSLDIPFPPQGSSNEWRGGLYGRGPGGPGGRGGGGGSGRGGPGDHGEDGVIHFGLAEMAADWSVAEAAKSSAEEENAIARTLIGLQVDPDSAQGKGISAQLRSTYQTAARGTQFSEKETAMAGAVYARELGFTAKEGGVDRFQKSFPVALRSAEIAEQEGLGSLDGSLTASLEYAHMTRRYEPAELSKSLNILQQVSTLTDNSMSKEESILKYVVPLGKAGGMDPDRLAEITGFVQQSGYNSSTAGTGLSQLMLGILQSGGGINAHLEHGRADSEKALSNALGLDAAGVSKSRAEAHDSRHVSARRDLGLIDAHNNLTVLNKQGGIDVDALIDKITEHTAKMSPHAALEKLIDAFGDRGGRIAALFTGKEGQDRLHQFEGNVETGAAKFGAEMVQKMLTGTVEQQWGQLMARMADLANNAFAPLMGGAHAALSGVNSALDFSTAEMQAHPLAAGAIGAGATLGAAYGTFRVGKGAVGLAKRLLGGGAARTGGGAAVEAVEAGGAGLAGTEAGGGLLAGLGGLFSLPALGIGAAGIGAGLGLGYVAHHVDNHSATLRGWDDWTAGKARTALGYLNPFSYFGSSEASAPAAGPAAAAARAAGGSVVNVTVGPITLNGVGVDIKPMVENLFHTLADRLGQSLSHASGTGQGQTVSPFTGGAH